MQYRSRIGAFAIGKYSSITFPFSIHNIIRIMPFSSRGSVKSSRLDGILKLSASSIHTSTGLIMLSKNIDAYSKYTENIKRLSSIRRNYG